jgi:hypothetical protein
LIKLSDFDFFEFISIKPIHLVDRKTIVITYFIKSCPQKRKKKRVNLFLALEIVAIFEPSPFWKYTKYPQELLDKADNFITTFQNELKALIDQ